MNIKHKESQRKHRVIFFASQVCFQIGYAHKYKYCYTCAHTVGYFHSALHYHNSFDYLT
jgi:hypothetical protein